MGLSSSSFFSYSRCNECHTLGTTIYPTEETLGQLYSRMPPNMDEAIGKADQQKNQGQYARYIVRYLSGLGVKTNHVSVLELGADCGLLASEISRVVNTADWHYSAIEPNEPVRAELANTLAKKYGSHRLHIDAREITKEKANNLFDIIVAVHVFDHIFSIEEMLTSLKSLLTENGFIYFVVHNPESTLARVLGSKWPPFCAQHPQLFTMRGVRALANRIGLEVTDYGRTINHFPLSMVGDFMGMKVKQLDNISICAPLGNRFYILMNKETA